MSEIVTALDTDDARRLTERIRLIAGNVADNVEKLRELVEQARVGNAHVALGYDSWTAYLRDVFGDEPLRLVRDVRQELVAELAAQGMSSRAAAERACPEHGCDRGDLPSVERPSHGRQEEHDSLHRERGGHPLHQVTPGGQSRGWLAPGFEPPARTRQ